MTNLIAEKGELISIKYSRKCLPISLCLSKGVPNTVTVSMEGNPLSETRRRVSRCKLSTCVRAQLSSKLRTLGPKRNSALIVTKVNNPLVREVLASKTRIERDFQRVVLRPRSSVPRFHEFIEGVN